MQKYGLYLILIFFSIALITYNILASPISVPVDHWSYQFIERFQTKGILRDFLSSIKPYSRDEMAGMIMYISNMIESGKVSLNKIEKEQFEMMKREFAQELTDLGMVGIKKYKHLVDWIGNEKRFTAEAGYTQNAISKKGTEDHSIYKGALQVILYGVLKNSLYENHKECPAL